MFQLGIKRTEGTVDIIHLDGDDVEEIIFITTCGYCGKRITFDEYEFRQIAAKTDFYSPWYCDVDCSERAKFRKNRAFQSNRGNNREKKGKKKKNDC